MTKAKGDVQVIAYLNQILANELVAINQYFLHAKIMNDRGLDKLGAHQYAESIDEMKHAEMLVDRILFLGGLPNLQSLGKLTIGETTEQMLKADLDLENRAIPCLKEAIAYVEKVHDFVSRDLLAKILTEEESHVDWLQKQLLLIETVGIENYHQHQMA
jgi:bacterioferritin